MTIDLDYAVSFNARGKAFNIKILEQSPKDANRLSEIFSTDEPTIDNYKEIYNIVIGGSDKDALLDWSVQHDMLPQVVNKLLGAYIDLKKISLD